jgi:transcriptional regulator of acetoin/glycerol metabolism
MSYPWPGNIRELRHAVERAVIMSDGNKLMVHHFLTANDLNKILQISSKDSVNINDLEKRTIATVINKCEGNLSKAAQELGLGRTTLYRKIKKYNLKF